MDGRDPLDSRFLVFVGIIFVGLLALGYTIFPDREHATQATPATSGSVAAHRAECR
jgi:hypothetical protein